MSDPDTRIHGTPDLVERSGGRLRVVDLKSGLRQADFTEGQRRQLLLYGHLVARTLGEDPDDLVITDSAGRETIIAFSSADIAEAVRLAVHDREAWNTAIASDGPIFALGSPSSKSCRGCPFRVVCLPYWENLRDDWEMPASISGTVEEITGTGDRTWIGVTQDLPAAARGNAARVVGLSEIDLAVGDHVVITDLDRIGREAFRLRWWSRVQRIDAQGAYG
jgi:hypothetical protein